MNKLYSEEEIERRRSCSAETVKFAIEAAKSNTAKAKRLITFAERSHQQGEKNSQFGKMWIHSLEERKSKRINNNEPIPSGWIKGRKMFK